MSFNDEHDINEKNDFQEKQQELQLFPKQATQKNKLSKKKKLRLARLKRLNRLERFQIIDLNELWNMIPSFSMFQYYFKSIFSVEFKDFLISLSFIIIIYFSSNLGLYLPSRYEILSLNTTLKIGFFPEKTVFYPNFSFMRNHSKFLFYYHFKARDDPFSSFDPQAKNEIRAEIKLETLSIDTVAKTFDTTISKYNDTDVQPLFDIVLDQPTDSIKLEIKFIGDLTSYKTFIIKSIVFNTKYLDLLKYYRFIFILIGFVLSIHSFIKFLDFQNVQIIGSFLIVANLPSMIYDFEKSIKGQFIQKIADQLFTQSILIFWVYKTCRRIDNKRSLHNRFYKQQITQPIMIFFLIIEIFQTINILASSMSEHQNTYEYLSEGPKKSDKVFILSVAFLIFLAYIINSIDTGSMRVNLANFFFFSSQICFFCDELIERCKVVKCIGMVKWMRMFSELVACFFMFVVTQNDESESSERVMNAIPLNFEDESSMSKK